MSAGDNDGRDFNAKDGLTRIWYAVERVTDKKKAWFRNQQAGKQALSHAEKSRHRFYFFSSLSHSD